LTLFPYQLYGKRRQRVIEALSIDCLIFEPKNELIFFSCNTVKVLAKASGHCPVADKINKASMLSRQNFE
jgi:hypothetical protein